ncbi:TPA: DUF1540 domain-containing protein [Clostridium perfringens]
MEHNSSIGCTVNECKHHCHDDNYCTLDKIQVIKNSADVNSTECTDCGSFEKK